MENVLSVDIDHVRSWLILKEDVLKVRKIAEKADIPVGSLYHLLRGRRELSPKHVDNLVKVISELGYDSSVRTN